MPTAEPGPASGARWGRPSAFTQSRQVATESPALQGIADVTPADEPQDYMRVIPAELMVEAEKVRVQSAADPDTWVDVDRMLRMAFAYTDFPPKSSPAGLTPTRTTIFDLGFDLHPPDEATP